MAYKRNLFQASLGVIGGQCIAFAALPLFGRLFLPEEVGRHALLLACVQVVTVIAGLRLEMAIPVAKSQAEADAIHRLVSKIGIPLSLVGSLACIPLFGSVELPWWSCGILVLWSYASMVGLSARLWLQRQGHFKTTAKIQVLQAAMMAGLPIFLGWFIMPTWIALSAGTAIAISVTAAISVFIVLRKGWQSSRAVTDRIIVSLNREFIIFLLPAHVVTMVAALIPVAMLGQFFGSDTSGSFQMASQLLFAPLAFASQAVQQVFYPRISEEIRLGNSGRLIFDRTLLLMIAVGLPFFLGLTVLGGWGVPWLLGQQWHDAGWMAACLAPYLAVSYLASPLSSVLLAAGKQRSNLAWQILRLFLTVISLFVPVYLHWDWRVTIHCYGAAMALSYGILLYMSWQASGNSARVENQGELAS